MNKEEIGYYQSNIKTSRNEDSVYAMKYASQQMLINKLEQENNQLHNKIDKAIEILKEHFVEEYIRSCDTSDGVGRYEIDTEHWTYKVYEQLKDSDVDEN